MQFSARESQALGCHAAAFKPLAKLSRAHNHAITHKSLPTCLKGCLRSHGLHGKRLYFRCFHRETRRDCVVLPHASVGERRCRGVAKGSRFYCFLSKYRRVQLSQQLVINITVTNISCKNCWHCKNDGNFTKREGEFVAIV